MKITHRAQKQLMKMDRKQAGRLLSALEKHEADGSGDVKKLKGREGFRLRSGDYRAVFEMEGGEIILLDAAHRKDIYR